MYHAAMGAMQGQGPQEIYDRICDLLMDMQKAQWVRIHQNYGRYHHDSNSRTNYKNEFISPSSPFFFRPFGSLSNWLISTLYPCGISWMLYSWQAWFGRPFFPCGILRLKPRHPKLPSQSKLSGRSDIGCDHVVQMIFSVKCTFPTFKMKFKMWFETRITQRSMFDHESWQTWFLPPNALCYCYQGHYPGS